MEYSFTIKYDDSACHSLMFDIGDTIAYPLCFSLDVAHLDLDMNKECLFLHHNQRVDEYNPIINFKVAKRKTSKIEQQKQLINKSYEMFKNKDLFVYQNNYEIKNYTFGYLLSSPRSDKRLEMDEDVLLKDYYDNKLLMNEAVIVKELSDKNELIINNGMLVDKNKLELYKNEYKVVNKNDNNTIINNEVRVIDPERKKRVNMLADFNKYIYIDNRNIFFNKGIEVKNLNPNIFKFDPKALERRSDSIKLNDTEKSVDTDINNVDMNADKIVSTNTNDLDKKDDSYLIKNKTPDILKHEDILIDNGLDNKVIVDKNNKHANITNKGVSNGWDYIIPVNINKNGVMDLNTYKMINKNAPDIYFQNIDTSASTSEKDILDVIKNGFLFIDNNNYKLYTNDNITTEKTKIGLETGKTNYNVSKHSQELKIDDDKLYLDKYSDSLIILENLELLVDKDSKKTNLDKYYNSLYKKCRDTIIYDSSFDIEVKNRESYIDNSNKKVNRKDNDISYYNSYKSLYKNNNELTDEVNKEVLLSKYKYKLNNSNKLVYIEKNLFRSTDVEKNIYLNLYDRDVILNKTGIYMSKDNYTIETSNLFDFKLISKYYEGIYNHEYIMINKDLKSFDVNYYYINIGKDAKGIKFDEVIKSISKSGFGMFESNNSFGIAKDSKAIFTNESYFSIADGGLGIRFDETYMPINKNPKGVVDFYKDLFINKYGKPIVRDESMLLVNKSIKDSHIFYEVLEINKNIKDTHMFYENPFISKSMKHSSITYENTFINKNIKDSHMDYYLLNVSKINKGIELNKDVLANYDSRRIDLNGELKVDYDNKAIDINDSISVKYDSYGIHINQDELLKFNLDSKKAIINKLIDIDIKREGELYKNYMYLHRTIYEGNKTDTYKFTDVSRNIGDIAMPDATMVIKKLKDTKLPLQSNFIYYDGGKPYPVEPEEPEKYYNKKDELLLPHKDYKYSDFLSKLLNEDGSINLAYVKSYDPSTGIYTVKIPVENPIDIYADVGRDYLDLEVYVLDTVTYIIKTIWKDNMFKYMNMSALDSLKDIMIKADLEINKLWNSDKIQKPYYMIHAQRCMQLFRWYCEMAILNNCEYELVFDTAKISVDYYNKSLGDFENIITFNNMEITNNYIIEPIDNTQECGIEFLKDISSTVPYNLSFRLYNINTSCSISIVDDMDNETVKTYDLGIHDVNIMLKNKATVSHAPAKNGTYKAINIANIVIDNKTVRGFRVNYKGVFGEVNSVMQDLLNFMLIVGPVSEDVKNKFKNVSPVTVAVDKIKEYFELHHQDKLKGKRLITKK